METWAQRVESVAPTVGRSIVGPDGAVWSGTELIERAAGATEWLEQLGVRLNSTVPALVATDPTAIALVLAGASSGRPIAPLGVRLSEPELLQILRRVEGDVLVASPDFAELGQRLSDQVGKRFAVLEGFPRAPGSLRHCKHSDDVAAIVHTSGTTGLPKPVPYRNAPLGHRVKINASLMGFGPEAAYGTASPFHHIAGLGNVFVALASGTTLVSMPQFSVEEWLRLGDLGITHAFAAPSMIEMLLMKDSLRIPGLRLLQYGASAIRPETLRAAMEKLPGVDFINFFGQTEGSPITVLSPEDHRRAADGRPDLLNSVGRPPEAVELKIHNADSRGIGEVWARADHYFRVDDDGWLQTGDLGYLDEDGYLFLTGRKGDLIIRGGENVYPLEVESALISHPQVRDAGVVAKPDDRLGEVPKAFIVPADKNSPPDFEDLRAHVRAQLSGFKVPTQWEYIPVLPRDASGKLQRRRLP